MSSFVRSLRRFARNLNAVPFGDVLAQVYDRWAHVLVVRDHGKSAPSYREGTDAEVYAFTLDTTTLPDDPNTTAPTSGAGLLDVAAFGGLCLYWRGSADGELIIDGTADSAGAADIVLDVLASGDDDAYNGKVIIITGGTGLGQHRTITDYVGATQTASVAAWAVQPDNTSTYEIRESAGATHTDIDLTVWALADTGDWVQIASEAALAPFVELSVPGTGYRQVFVRVTDTNGGDAGDIDLLVAGD